MNKQPEQTAKTKQTIINAFWELAEKQGIDKVTVSSIAKKANLNRGTFYVYFIDVFELLEQEEHFIIEDLKKQIRACITDGIFNNPEILMQKFVDCFILYDKKLFLLLSKNGDPHFLELIKTEATFIFDEVFKLNKELPYRDYIIAYGISAFTGVLTFWHSEGRIADINKISKVIYTLQTRGIFGMVENYKLSI